MSKRPPCEGCGDPSQVDFIESGEFEDIERNFCVPCAQADGEIVGLVEAVADAQAAWKSVHR